MKSEINKNQKPKTEDRKASRFWLIGVLSIFAIGATGFYLWRENAKNIATTNPPVKTVAVLPFKALVSENRNEVLEFGMADTLIVKLSGGEEVIVRPFSAVRRYGLLDKDSLTAGRELGVESVLDGTIQNWGDRIRVSARLLRTSDGKQLWAGQFDEKLTDIFAVQDSISERVAAALKIRLGNREKNHQTENVEAYQLYMKGRYHILKLELSETNKAISYFQQAIAVDQSYARAYLGLANSYRSLVLAGEMTPTEFLPKAKAAANKAIEIDDTLAEAHAELCYIVFRYDWNWNEAGNHCKRALELDPNDAEAHHAYAHVFSIAGRHSEGLAEIKRARELDPLNLRISTIEAQFLIYAERTDEALFRLQKAIELEPDFWFTHNFASSAYIEKGMYAEAIAEAHKARELSGGITQPIGFLGYALAKSGKKAEARTELEALLKLSTERYVPPYHIALIYNGLGERDETLAWLERGFEQRDPRMTFLKVEPKWNNLRNEPRFIDLMRRMNFE